MAVEVVDDRLALPFFDPVVPRHQAVVLIHLFKDTIYVALPHMCNVKARAAERHPSI